MYVPDILVFPLIRRSRWYSVQSALYTEPAVVEMAAFSGILQSEHHMPFVPSHSRHPSKPAIEDDEENKPR